MFKFIPAFIIFLALTMGFWQLFITLSDMASIL